MMESNDKIKPSGIALLPLVVFIGVYLAFGIYYLAQGTDMAFYQFPSVTALMIGVFVAFAMFKGKIDFKFKIFARGVGNEDVLTMLVIYMLAGAFSAVASAMGGRDATVNLGLSLVPVQFLAAGIFIISAFMGTATGTSCGTISAITPIALGVALKGNLNPALVVGACIGGAMFGDNLSMISDTTIAATRSQGCEMKDKFRVNLFMALPAAVCTVIFLLIFGRPESAPSMGDLSFNIIKVLPYILVLVLALIGMNVFLVLALGIIVALIAGFVTSSLTIPVFAQSVWAGIQGMDETFYLTIFMSGLAELITHFGGIQWIIEKMSAFMKGNKSAQVCIAAIVGFIDCCLANNTVAIIVSGKMAREISEKYKVDPRRTASILDVFSCVFQGFIPYSAQPLIAASLVSAAGISMSSVHLIPYIWYCYFLAFFGILSIFIPFADGVCKKDPWNWEKKCSQSKADQA